MIKKQNKVLKTAIKMFRKQANNLIVKHLMILKFCRNKDKKKVFRILLVQIIMLIFIALRIYLTELISILMIRFQTIIR